MAQKINLDRKHKGKMFPHESLGESDRQLTNSERVFKYSISLPWKSDTIKSKKLSKEVKKCGNILYNY